MKFLFTIALALFCCFCGDRQALASKDLSQWADDAKTDGKVIILRPRGGFGNRFGAMASVYALAQISHRTLLLDWELLPNGDGFETAEMPARFDELFTNSVLTLDTYNLENHVSEETSLEFLKYSGKTRKRACEALVDCGRYQNLLIYGEDDCDANIAESVMKSDREIVYFDGINRDFTGLVLDGTASSISVKRKFLDAYLEFLQVVEPVPVVNDWVTRFSKDYFHLSDREKNKLLVGIHYRSFSKEVGDIHFADHPSIHTKSSLFNKFTEVMNSLVAQMSKSGIQVEFFLATDTRSVIEPFRKNVNAKILFFDHDKNMQGISRHDVPSQLGGLIDFYLLAQTDFIIGSYQSTFSDLASIMTRLGQKVSIGPKVFAKKRQVLLGTSDSEFYQKYVRILEKMGDRPSLELGQKEDSRRLVQERIETLKGHHKDYLLTTGQSY